MVIFIPGTQLFVMHTCKLLMIRWLGVTLILFKSPEFWELESNGRRQEPSVYPSNRGDGK